MAGKKKKNELDGLKAEVTALSEAVWALRDQLTARAAADAARENSNSAKPVRSSSAPATNGATATLEQRTRSGDNSGFVSSYGYYESGDRGYRWSREEIPAGDLLALDDDRAAQFLSALGHRQRMAILKAVLERPCSATELVERLHLGTTGAAYHHLNVLQAAGLVTQESRGTFAVHGHRVQGFLTLLAGIADMMDTTYSAGPFDLAHTNMDGDDSAG